ncbi:hypothetical protein LZF95_08315 [Algoriphagus sp. AGSA1]|uniref:hypothetical protein n=1 Tax=Algoriphagus sp. AGSA1 TaxID=2907213 RepID=UPI001F18879F|nr:hypothetical protein [Algoriphagus sp. AGSA1]MCE7054673.1 hypothetical protein [Algoriphagus sp. AGSA1]
MKYSKLMDYSVLLKIQSIYFLGTGIWPLVSISTFLDITGPKNDLWLVKVVGILISVIGFVLLVASFDKKRNHPIILLAIASSAALGLVDIVFFVSNTIPAIYLLDAVAEFILILLWAWNIRTRRKL